LQNLISFINEKTNNKYAYLKLSTATYQKFGSVLLLVFLYPDEIGNVEEEDRKQILKLTKAYVNLEVNIELKFVKSFYDKEHLIVKIDEFNKQEFPSLTSLIQTKKLNLTEEEDKVNLELCCSKNYISNEQKQKYIARLEQFLNNEFFYLFEVTLKEVQEQNTTSVIEQKKQEVLLQIKQQQKTPTHLKVEVIDQVLGSECSLAPLCVSAVTSPDKNVSVAGEVKYLTEREFTKKQRVMDSEEERYQEIQKTYYSFSLQSAEKELNAVYFPSKDGANLTELVSNGQEVVVTGDVDAFNGRLSLKVKHITKVKILNKPKQNKQYNPVPKTYQVVKPEPFEVKTQANLFEQLEEPTTYLKQNTFVVFDLETTGLNHEDCQIVEIGAVKIEQGKITQKFSTFVDPEADIPLDATAIHGITNAMVMGAPKVDVALADFYKFCENSVIIAYNIDFDYKFINYYGRKNGFLFDHEQLDALHLAKKYIKGLKNYKLKTVAESLAVNLSNAHRAYFDAAATAEVFLKIAKNIK
jgi:DNA polymerase III epsilon subunit family exonuclease